MKNFLKIILCLFICLFLFGCNEISDTYYTPNDGIVIKYTENKYDFDGLKKNSKDFYVIEVYSDRTIKYGNLNDELKEKKLSVSQYNKLIEIAFSEEFYNEFFKDVDTENKEPEEIELIKDISKKEDQEKGTDSAIYIFSTNGGVIAVGGQDADNPLYNKLVRMIRKYGK